MNRFIFLTLTWCALGSASLAESLTNEVTQFLQLRLQTADATAPDESKLAAIAAWSA